MPAAQLPDNEEQRLEALHQYRIVDTCGEQAYDDITLLASQICDVPIALVTFVDRERQWLKSRIGIDVDETPRDVAFCAHAILKPQQLLEVRDATQDERFADNPLVLSGPKIRFYAGAPLVMADGFALGTLCVIDKKPRDLTPTQTASLMALSRVVVAQLKLRKALDDLSLHVAERASYEARLEAYQLRLEEINESLSMDSQTDKLTGLSNRRHFDELVAEEHDRCARRSRALSLMMVDVDFFKAFNDSFGHAAGDETLRRVAQILNQSKRAQDHVARYGGEEFVMLMPDTSEEGAMILAERIRKAVQNYPWDVRPVTISLGVCTSSGGDADLEQLVRGADAALYESKHAGRNRVTLGQAG